MSRQLSIFAVRCVIAEVLSEIAAFIVLAAGELVVMIILTDAYNGGQLGNTYEQWAYYSAYATKIVVFAASFLIPVGRKEDRESPGLSGITAVVLGFVIVFGLHASLWFAKKMQYDTCMRTETYVNRCDRYQSDVSSIFLLTAD